MRNRRNFWQVSYALTTVTWDMKLAKFLGFFACFAHFRLFRILSHRTRYSPSFCLASWPLTTIGFRGRKLILLPVINLAPRW